MSDTDDKKKGQVKPIKEFFGVKDGQNMTDFLAEYKALTEEDKTQLAEGITNGSLTY